MTLHEDPHHTFRFADERTIPRFHLDGVAAGTPVAVYRINPVSEARRELLTTAVAGDGGWVDLAEPLRVRAGAAFVAVPDAVARLVRSVEDGVRAAVAWAAFEPNAEPTWAHVCQVVADDLTGRWRQGAFAGAKPEQAFFVRCDRTTMTQADIDNGVLVCLVGVAPVKPAEFVVIPIRRWTAEAGGASTRTGPNPGVTPAASSPRGETGPGPANTNCPSEVRQLPRERSI